MVWDRRQFDKERWEARRAHLVEMRGGQCTDCGSREKLEFDHRDPGQKLFAVSSGPFRPMAKIIAEAMKCDLRCHECHRQRTASQQSLGHGKGLTGVRRCNCEQCKPLKVQYMRDWRARNGRKKNFPL